MANSLRTTSEILREAIRLYRNSNDFLQAIPHQYDDQFARAGAKIGTQLRIRLPNDYIVSTGPAASPQDTAEPQTVLTVATQKHVDVSFSTVDLTMSLSDFSTRVLAPMINNLAGAVAMDVISGTEGGVSNAVGNFDGSGNVLTPTISTFLLADAALHNFSAAKKNRKIFLSPNTNARTVGQLSGLFNPQRVISEQFTSGQMGPQALNFEWFSDQTVPLHTTATYSGSLTVNGAGQTGTTLVTNAITGGLALGDIFTIAGVNAVNRVTKNTTGGLAQFAVTAAAASGATSLSIYPAIIPPVSGNAVQYQTVAASPANGATITPVSLASAAYRKNIAFAEEAITIATADLVIPDGVWMSGREEFDGVSMRFVSQYAIGTDQSIARIDVLYGYLFVRPEWCVVILDNA